MPLEVNGRYTKSVATDSQLKSCLAGHGILDYSSVRKGALLHMASADCH